MRRKVAWLAALMLAASAGVAVTSIATPKAAAATGFGSDWPVYHHDALGSGADPAGTSLSPATTAWTSSTLDGQIYGEPLVEDGRVYVATENNTVYALAANTGAVLWSQHIAAPVPSGDLPCGDIGPAVGITSTPVIDPSRNEIFVVDDELTGGSGASHHLVGLDLFSGAIELHAVADPPGSHPLYQLQRPGLALDANQVIVGFGGNAGDCETSSDPYHGWLVALPESGGAIRTFEVASKPGDSQGAVWMGGAPPVVDGAGNVWVATGNSAFSSSSDPYDNSDGVLELSSSLGLEHFFAPSSWFSDNGSDLDLGSSSPSLMSDGLLLQAGKSRHAYVTSQSSPGGVGGQEASVSSYCGADVDGGSAVAGEVVYTPCEAGVVKTQVTPGSPPTISSVWKTSTGSGGPPILSGGLVWTIDPGNATLYGLDPTTGDASQSFPLGSEANHFPTPSVADGLLLAPSSDAVHAFDGPGGLPPAPPPPTFRVQPGGATDVSAGADGSIWVVGGNAVSGGFGVYRWNGGGWTEYPGGAVSIAVDPHGKPWVTNSAHHIYHWNGSSWTSYAGAATDIGVGADGVAWIIGASPINGGYAIYRRSGSAWSQVPGAGVRIAVDRLGNAWMTNSLHRIYHWTGSAWSQFPGGATDVGAGADGAVWIVGGNAVSGGFGIYHWNGSSWSQVPGGAVRITVDPNGYPWVVNSSHKILSY
jgi:polyvinyl alcohol dehydrogenase (cytochrome)